MYIDGYNLAIDGLLRLPEIEAWPAHADQVVSVAITPQTSEHDPGRRRNLDLGLLMGLIQTESRFDAGATSRTGAAGLGQPDLEWIDNDETVERS